MIRARLKNSSFFANAKVVTSQLTFIFSVLFTPNAQSENLLDVYQQAQQNDHLFRAARADYEAGLESKNQSRSALLPQISGQVYIEDSETDRDGPSLSDPSPSLTSNGKTTGYQVSLQQPIFNLSAWYGYKNGAALASIAEASFVAEQQSLILRTAEAYFNVLRSLENFSTSSAEETALGQQLEQARQRFDVGLIAITEVHEAQAAHDSARAEKINAEGEVGIAFDALEVLTGRPYQRIAPFKDTFPVQIPLPDDRQAWIDLAVKNNAQLRIQSLTAEAAQLTAKAQKAEHLPTLTGSLSHSKLNIEQDTSIGANADFDNEENTINLSLNIPIYSGGSVSSSRRRAAKESIAARERYLQEQRDTVQSARSLYLSVRTGVATVQARKQAIVSSRSALEATKAGYDVGTRDLVDVLNAQRNVYSAERDHDDALYNYVINALNLKATAGTLAEKDLSELTTWLDEAGSLYRKQ